MQTVTCQDMKNETEFFESIGPFSHAKPANIRVEQLDRLLARRNLQLGDDCVGQLFALLHPV